MSSSHILTHQLHFTDDKVLYRLTVYIFFCLSSTDDDLYPLYPLSIIIISRLNLIAIAASTNIDSVNKLLIHFNIYRATANYTCNIHAVYIEQHFCVELPHKCQPKRKSTVIWEQVFRQPAVCWMLPSLIYRWYIVCGVY